MPGHTNYRDIIKNELKKRCEKNSRYSLRAFARDLDLAPSRLSEVLNARTGLSREKAEEIATHLGMNSDEKEFFCTLVESEHARSEIDRELAKTKLAKFHSKSYSSLEVDHFKVVSDWYHFAILQLTQVKDFQSDQRWIASALGISEIEVKLAIERLVRLEYLAIKRKKYILTENYAHVSSATPSGSLRKFHRQILQKAIDAIDLQSIDQRDLGAMIMSVNAKDIPAIKEKIRDFRKELNHFTQQNSNRNTLYCVSTQLFELTSGEKK